MADTVAFPEQASLPDDLSTFCSLLQVLVLFENLPEAEEQLALRPGSDCSCSFKAKSKGVVTLIRQKVVAFRDMPMLQVKTSLTL